MDYDAKVRIQKVNLYMLAQHSQLLEETMRAGTTTQEDVDITERVVSAALEQKKMLERINGGPLELEPRDLEKWTELKDKVRDYGTRIMKIL